jgi:tRNA (guanine37-N1)-methyltransferase
MLNQSSVNQWALKKSIIILCGHYQGVDERIIENYITKTISIGQYVLSSGELSALVFLDAMIRILPGVLQDPTIALQDSFQDDMIAPPCYTKPSIFQNKAVPEVLLSGHKQKIDEWKLEQSLKRTEEYKQKHQSI